MDGRGDKVCCFGVCCNLGFLWNLRTMSDRYQESKFVTMASIFAGETFLIGVPILIAVGDSSEARYIVLCSCIAFSDLGIMLMIVCQRSCFNGKGCRKEPH
jgi:hypothetical protein